MAVLLVLVVDFFGLSFFRYLDAADEPVLTKADAIVVFSGDPARIKRGFELLAEGRAPRLFIAGLDNGEDIEAEKKKMPALAKCCVEVNASSRNTHEDARAIAAWTRSHGPNSLIVVTTNLHMPRAMAELGGMIPLVTLVPAGISQGLYDSRDWRHNAVIRPRLALEAMKFVLARLGSLAGYLGFDVVAPFE